MPENIFRFKQFSIKQDRCAMKVGTDGVLLGAWTDVKGANNILDAGCGTGLLALMLAQKSNAAIDAIDIDESAFTQAKINISESKWCERVYLYQCSLQEYAKLAASKYDLVISNPPFFQNAFKPQNESRATARHNGFLSYDDLIQSSFALLNNSGKLSIILPFEDANTVKIIGINTGFYIIRTCCIIPKPNKKAKRLMIEFSKAETNEYKEEELVIENEQRHQYTSSYIALTKEYYLKF